MNTYEFKHNRSRLLIVGYGDIGKRILEQKLKYPDSTQIRDIFYEQFRVLIVSRSGLANLDKNSRATLKNKRVLELKLDLDDYKNIKKITKLPTHVIVLIPTSNYLSNDSVDQTGDFRMKKFCVSLSGNDKTGSCKGVYISTTGVYGNTKGKVVDETYLCKPSQLRSKRRLFAEKKFKTGPRFHILRVPGIYAENRLPIERLKANKPALLSSEDVYSNHTHAEDLARISFISLFRGKPCRTTNAVDNSKLKMAEYFDEVAKALNLTKPPRISRKEMKKLAAEKKISPMMASFFEESRQLKNHRLTNELKVLLNFPDVISYLKKLSKK